MTNKKNSRKKKKTLKIKGRKKSKNSKPKPGDLVPYEFDLGNGKKMTGHMTVLHPKDLFSARKKKITIFNPQLLDAGRLGRD